MIARISVCAATFVLAIAWLALIEPVASSVLDELKVLNSTGLKLTHIERSAKRKAAQIVAVVNGKTPPRAVRGLLSHRRQIELKAFLERRADPASSQTKALGSAQLLGEYDKQDRQKKWAQAAIGSPASVGWLRRISAAWLILLAALLTFMRWMRVDLLRWSLHNAGGSGTIPRTGAMMAGWSALPMTTAPAGPVRDPTGWRLDHRCAPWSTVALIGGLFLIAIRVAALSISFPPG